MEILPHKLVHMITKLFNKMEKYARAEEVIVRRIGVEAALTTCEGKALAKKIALTSEVAAGTIAPHTDEHQGRSRPQAHQIYHVEDYQTSEEGR